MEDVIHNFIIFLGDTNSSDEDSSDGNSDSAVVLILKMWNHLCLILFPYNAGKWTDVFGIGCSVKFLSPHLSIFGDFLCRAHYGLSLNRWQYRCQ
jgi:hypothetical protein